MRAEMIALLEETFPWLATEEEVQVSGADTVDELQSMYYSLKANLAAEKEEV